MKKKWHITQYSICVPLTHEQWDKLSIIDDSSRHQWPKCYEAFIAKMEKSGADEIEFNGHFGSNFFFTVEKLFHAERVTKKLLKLLS